MDTYTKTVRPDGATDPRLMAEPGAVEEAIGKARAHLVSLQSPGGYWVGELEADASVSAGYIPLMQFMLGRVDEQRQRKVVDYVLGKQNDDGSWSSYYGGEGDLNVTIQVYFALKLAGMRPGEPVMSRARQFVLSRGGIGRSSVFTKIWLALFGQFDWRYTPSLPPELILLPNWFYFNIYEFASWSRETIMALMVVLTTRPVCRIPDSVGVGELYLEPEGRRNYPLGKIEKLFSWKSFFLLADSAFKLWERLPVKPGRALALRRTVNWIVEHQEADGSWGGIMLPWIYSLMALKSLGYPLDHPVIARGMQGLEGFIVEDETALRLQPATSPVWDTAWSVLALREAGLAENHPSLVRAASWLLDQEIRVGGDWQVKNPHTEPGGWAFEFHNDLYPDIDDSPVVARALGRVRLRPESEARKEEAMRRSARWVISMQSKDGGYSAFDRDNDKQFLTQIPFADFMPPLDPTCADVTAHVVEMLGELKLGPDCLQKAMDYLKRSQQADGTWYGRWGVNYLYGTGLVLAALGAAGEEMSQAYLQKAASWLASRQNPDGGWGESCHSYEDPRTRGMGPSTASQTAWALAGLIAAGHGKGLAVKKGIDFLIRTQREDGSWDEEQYTGTGFPRSFYLHYDLYRACFPLMTLARYRHCLEELL